MQLTVRDVARLLRVPERDVAHWIENEELPAYRVNNTYRFNRAELLEWASSRKIPVPPGWWAPAAGASSVPTLTKALESGRVFYGIKGSDKPSVLRAVVQAMPFPSPADRANFLSIILARETLASTGIGDGIAVPHVRNPVLFPIVHPQVSIFFLDKAVDYGALDGKPVHTVITLVSPTIRAHLHLLSRIVFSARSPAFREAIQHRARHEELLTILRTVEVDFRE